MNTRTCQKLLAEGFDSLSTRDLSHLHIFGGYQAYLGEVRKFENSYIIFPFAWFCALLFNSCGKIAIVGTVWLVSVWSIYLPSASTSYSSTQSTMCVSCILSFFLSGLLGRTFGLSWLKPLSDGVLLSAFCSSIGSVVEGPKMWHKAIAGTFFVLGVITWEYIAAFNQFDYDVILTRWTNKTRFPFTIVLFCSIGAWQILPLR
jgi:hypothetical protein